jgi:hypothetical protein
VSMYRIWSCLELWEIGLSLLYTPCRVLYHQFEQSLSRLCTGFQSDHFGGDGNHTNIFLYQRWTPAWPIVATPYRFNTSPEHHKQGLRTKLVWTMLSKQTCFECAETYLFEVGILEDEHTCRLLPLCTIWNRGTAFANISMEPPTTPGCQPKLLGRHLAFWLPPCRWFL